MRICTGLQALLAHELVFELRKTRERERARERESERVREREEREERESELRDAAPPNAQGR